MKKTEFDRFLERLGRSIAEHRRGRSISQEYLSQQIQRSPQHLSKIERGVKTPSLDALWLICKSLDISIESVLSAASLGANDSNRDVQLELKVLLGRVPNKKAQLILEVAKVIAATDE